MDWVRCLPFLAIHLACLLVVWVGWSWVAVGAAAAAYLLRIFCITAFYHRQAAHRAFKTSRLIQFLGAAVANAAAQRGPLWWAAHHRHHHATADTAADRHSPLRHGFWRSHVTWFMTPAGFATPTRHIPDLLLWPELRFLDRFDWLAPGLFLGGTYLLGAGLARVAPELATSGPQMAVWGGVVSTVALYHGTFAINSLAHLWGSRRYATRDDSRNNGLLALLTLGEGWHNNHHHYPSAARQGFFWWEVDVTYTLLVLLSWLGLVWELKPLPAAARARNRIRAAPEGVGR